MRRFRLRLAVSAILSLVCLSAFAQEASAAAGRVRHRHLRECLSILGLTDQQKTDIQGIFDAAKPEVEADVATVRAARQTLRAAVGSVPPDACAIGSDALALETALKTLAAERDAVRTQVFATLTPDQQSRLDGCLDAPRPDAAVDDAAE
jgi:Spy/CpxP family protein refolding chaperone